MLNIRPAQKSDLSSVVAVHQAAFQGFFLAALGPGVLRQYYQLVLEHPGGILLVGETEDKTMRGFVAGFVDPRGFYALMKKRRLKLGVAAIPALIRSPKLIRRMLGNSRRVTDNADEESGSPERACELSTIAVEPQSNRHGYGRKLALAFEEHAQKQNADTLYLTTDAHDNDPVNRFYQSLNYTLAEVFEAPGQRMMNKYLKPLPDSNAPDSTSSSAQNS